MERSKIHIQNDADRHEFFKAFREGRPVHAAFRNCQRIMPELIPYFASRFAPALKRVFPLGHFTTMSAWVSASGHHYPRHNDLGDGLLLQLYGTKSVRVFECPSDYYDHVIFDHAFGFQPDPYPLESREYHLQAGDALFIPRGMPHEVRIADGERSIAVSFSAGGLYPLLELCKEINDLAGVATAFGLSASDSRRAKPLIRYFDPNSIATEDSGSASMPIRLKGSLIGVLKADDLATARTLPDLLDSWWRQLLVRRNHCPNGVYPVPPFPVVRGESAERSKSLECVAT